MDTKKKIFILILGVEALAIAGLIVFLFYLNSDTVKANHQLELAQHYLLEEDYEQAIAAYGIVIQIDPKNTEAYLGLAQAYTESGDLQKAIEVLEEGYQNTEAVELQEEKEACAIELAKIEAQKQEETALTTGIESQPENIETETENVAFSESTPKSEEITSVQTGFVTQDGELYYYDEQGNMVTGWFDVNSNRYCARQDGKLYKGDKYEIEGINYLFGSDGICFGEMKDDAWKQAYIDFVKQKHQEFWAQYPFYDNQIHDSYALIYVDNDNIPELAICPMVSAQYDGTFIVSYANGIVYSNPDCSVMDYIEREGMFYALKEYNDISATVQIFRIQDGKQTVIAEGHWVEEDYYYYEWNGVPLATWKEFESEISKVYDKGKAIQIDIYYTYEEILDRIANY